MLLLQPSVGSLGVHWGGPWGFLGMYLWVLWGGALGRFACRDRFGPVEQIAGFRRCFPSWHSALALELIESFDSLTRIALGRE